MRFVHLKALSAAGALATLAACSSMPEPIPMLDEAERLIAELERDPLATSAAGSELESARIAFSSAEDAWREDEERSLVEHRAYVAERHARIAEQLIAEARIMDSLEASEAQRNEVLLQVEEQRARAAEARAETALERAAALADELEAVQARESERGLVLTLGDILFDTDEAMLRPGAEPTLDRLAEFMRDFPNRRVRIEGHADARGPAAYNLDLSELRAAAVETALVARGIGSGRIDVVGLGEAYPVASNDTAAGMQQNRRVEFVISDENGRFPAAATERVPSLAESD